MRMFQKVRKDLTQDNMMGRLFFLVATLIAMYLSITMNVAYWSGVAQGGGLGSLATDLAKPLLVVLVAGYLRARQWGHALLGTVVLGGLVFLSLFAAYNLRVANVRDEQAQKLALMKKHSAIRKDYEDFKRKISGYAGLKTPQEARDTLKQAERAVPRRIWKRTSHCTDATRLDSRNACKQVNALRLALPEAERKWRVYQQYLAAKAAFNKLPVMPVPTVSDESREIAAMIYVLAIEILSAFGFMLATSKPKDRPLAPPRRKPGGDKPDELHWLDAMKEAATDPDCRDIHFDENGLLKAPLSKLAKVMDVKSTSTVSERLKTLEAKGLLERIGKGKGLRWRVLEEV